MQCREFWERQITVTLPLTIYQVFTVAFSPFFTVKITVIFYTALYDP